MPSVAQQAKTLFDSLAKIADLPEHVQLVLIEEHLKFMYAWGKSGTAVEGAA